MSDGTIVILALLFLAAGALYASVGHAGASGYLAVMALVGVDPAIMRPTALAINILVAVIAFMQFYRAGHFRWRLFWPFAIAAVPAAYLGGTLELSAAILKPAIGVVLLLSAARMAFVAWSAWRSPHASQAAPATRNPPAALAIGSGGILGLIAGLTGTGGGVFLSPLILMCRWATTKQTAAVAALFILCNSIAGLGGIATQGWRPAPWLMILAIFAAVGGFIGASYGSRHASPRALNGLLAAVLVIAGSKLVMS